MKAEAVWYDSPLKLLARRTVIQHLSRNTDCHVITDIPHPYSQEWKDYVDQYHPAFVMLSDGESLPKPRMRCILIRALLTSCLKLGIDCAFCSPLKRSLRSIDTFYIEARKVPSVYLALLKVKKKTFVISVCTSSKICGSGDVIIQQNPVP